MACSSEDVLGASIVLLQIHHHGVFIVGFHLFKVPLVRIPPSKDALIGIYIWIDSEPGGALFYEDLPPTTVRDLSPPCVKSHTSSYWSEFVSWNYNSIVSRVQTIWFC